MSHFSSEALSSRRNFLALAVGGAVASAMPELSAWAAESLLTRVIPSSGEQLPVIGLGTSIVFDVGDDAAQRSERRAVLQAMLAGGGRLIDTAPSYGTAEGVVGDLVADLGARSRSFLATKVRATDRAPAQAEMLQSLRRLRTDRVDLMQLHNVGNRDSEAAAQIAQLREWKGQGICRYIGITHYLDYAHDRLIELMQREKPDFVQVNYSLADRSVEQRLLSAASDSGTAVLINLPFGRGKLFNAVHGKALPAWAAEFDAASWGQFFLKYILAHDAVTCVIPGTDKPDYMLDNLNAGRGRLPDAALRRKMIEFYESLG
ncbi:aldo/keto reductase [Propionivibrio sp.]|uniref:aldo/keto reductase n=1 Tax=Propionivibrio sp. TaxID=2212460 RepID=UPI00261D15BE|nr:aldo/keto reductase [Propionivibrio sp.]